MDYRVKTEEQYHILFAGILAGLCSILFLSCTHSELPKQSFPESIEPTVLSDTNNTSNSNDNGDYSSSSEDNGHLYYHDENVACLAQVDFTESVAEDGTMTVRVPYDDYTLHGITTDRPFLAFAKQGERLPADNPRLGIVEIDENNETTIMRLQNGSISPDNQEIVFIGHQPNADDLQSIYWAAGPVYGHLSSNDIDAAMEQFAEELDDAGIDSIAVVDIPRLDADTAAVWVSSIEGQLEMTLFRSQSDLPEVNSFTQGSETEITFNPSKYKGFFEKIRPLSDPASKEYRDFSHVSFRDCWAVDGDGFCGTWTKMAPSGITVRHFLR